MHRTHHEFYNPDAPEHFSGRILISESPYPDTIIVEVEGQAVLVTREDWETIRSLTSGYSSGFRFTEPSEEPNMQI